ncbi:MAG: hypothetical protein HKN56_09160 [Gammaproteobacteria bacterium]|nr:hypothetical protein [Gammaproteobacteria bacterium]
MESFDAPAYAIGFFGLMFVVISLAADWLHGQFGLRELNPGERVLAFMLGLVLLSFFIIWRWLV